MVGRYRFSVAHEIGHWRLHRSLCSPRTPIRLLCSTRRSEPTVICRSSQAKEPIEWQADFYRVLPADASPLVLDEWKECLGRTRPLLLSDLRPNGQVMMRAQILDL